MSEETPKKKYHDALDDALDRPISYNPAFKKITNSTVAGIFLSQAWYWSKRHKEDDGWFWKTGTEWEEETGLTRSEQETARKHCLRVGVIEEKLKGIPATMYYRVVKSQVYTLLGLEIAEIQQTGQIAGNQQSDIHSNINNESETPSVIPSESEERSLDFKNMTVGEARKVSTLKLYTDATDYFPGSILWETVHNTITENSLTFEKIHSAAIAWAGRGFKPSNVQGILEWAVNGIPGGTKSIPESKPAINEKAVEQTREMVDKKIGGNFVPRPSSVPPPSIVQSKLHELSQGKGIRR